MTMATDTMVAKKKTPEIKGLKEIPEKSALSMDQGKILRDLEKYRKMFLDMGAEDAKVIPSHEIVQDIRVWWKCWIPRCYSSGANPHCPPLWKTDWDHAQRIRDAFDWAIAFKTKRRPEEWTGPRLLTAHVKQYSQWYPKEQREAVAKEFDEYVREIAEIKKVPQKDRVSKGTGNIGRFVVKQAQRDGHYWSMGFGIGSCMSNLCAMHGVSNVLCVALESGMCRFPYRVRPEGSASLYTDIVSLCGKLGWKVGLGAASIYSEDVPKDYPAYYIGLVFIG